MTAQTIARDARPEPVMELQGVSMRFGPTLAVKDLSVTFGTGEVVALIGENGAGKTTLGRIASGLVAPTTGQVCYRGEDVTSKLGTEMGLPGVEMVHQELSVVPTISVAENVLIGHEPNRFGFIHRKALRGQARKHLDFVGLDVDPATPCWKLPIAQQQMVEISRAVARDAEMIVFDEPTSSLTAPEVARLMYIVRRLRSEGRAIVFVSHQFNEVLEISDRIVVMRDGEHVGTYPRAGMTEDRMVELVVGRPLEDVYQTRAARRRSAEPALVVEQLAGPGVRSASLEVYPGEIVGIGGLIGSGRTELLELIYGARSITSGQLRLMGEKYRPHQPRDAIRRGLAMVPEDRRRDGLLPNASVQANIDLAVLPDVARGPLTSSARSQQLARDFVAQLRIKTPTLRTPVLRLSGGNQQKTLIARALSTTPKVLLLDEPARGIDIGAKNEVFRLVHQLADEGMAVLMVSSVLQELLFATHRIVVMRDGRTVGVLQSADADEEEVMSLAFTGDGRRERMTGAEEST